MDFFEATELSRRESLIEAALSDAFQQARNRHTVTRGDKDLLRRKHLHTLLAVNRYCRVRWGRMICEQVSNFFCDPGSLEPRRDILFVTLADVACMTAVDAANVDIDAMKLRLRFGLRGLSYLGMIEPGYYVNLQEGCHFERHCMSWHIHALVWGIGKEELESRLAALQVLGRYRGIAPGLKGVDVRPIKQGGLPKTTGYILKSPSRGYRVTKYEKRKDGTLYRNSKGTPQLFFLQGSEKLRAGERITIFHTMKPFYLDNLAVTGGEGAPLLAAAKRLALST